METILVTGGSGLVGSAISSLSSLYNFKFIFLNSKTCNLLNYTETENVFSQIKPDYIIHLAACVGGLYKNINFPVKMFEENIIININVLKAAHVLGVKKLVTCLSTCIFPDETSYPLSEDMLHRGPPHSSNEGYSYAKRMLEVQCRYYNKQYNCNFVCIIPTNIYGPHDNFNLDDAHVIPALIHNCYLSKEKSTPFVVKGTGKPLRQFIHSSDLAKIIMKMIETNEINMLIVSSTKEYSIGDIANMIAKKFEYEKHLIFDDTFSDGQYRKTVDNSKLLNFLGHEFEFTNLDIGICDTIDWFIDNYEKCRK